MAAVDPLLVDGDLCTILFSERTRLLPLGRSLVSCSEFSLLTPDASGPSLCAAPRLAVSSDTGVIGLGGGVCVGGSERPLRLLPSSPGTVSFSDLAASTSSETSLMAGRGEDCCGVNKGLITSLRLLVRTGGGGFAPFDGLLDEPSLPGVVGLPSSGIGLTATEEHLLESDVLRLRCAGLGRVGGLAALDLD